MAKEAIGWPKNSFDLLTGKIILKSQDAQIRTGLWSWHFSKVAVGIPFWYWLCPVYSTSIVTSG